MVVGALFRIPKLRETSWGVSIEARHKVLRPQLVACCLGNPFEIYLLHQHSFDEPVAPLVCTVRFNGTFVTPSLTKEPQLVWFAPIFYVQ